MSDQQAVRASSLARWASCEKRGLWAFHHPDETKREPHVATWIGTAVHALAAGAELPETPEMMRFDGITPDIRMAKLQIKTMADAVAEAADVQFSRHEVYLGDWQHEQWPFFMFLSGTADLIGIDGSGKYFIADLKTGAQFHSAWLQLGAYALLYEHSPDMVGKVETLCTIHCPRPSFPPAPDWGANLYFCDAHEAKLEAQRVLDRIAMLLSEEETPYAAPGRRCSSCEHPTCVVRTRGFSPLSMEFD